MKIRINSLRESTVVNDIQKGSRSRTPTRFDNSKAIVSNKANPMFLSGQINRPQFSQQNLAIPSQLGTDTTRNSMVGDMGTSRYIPYVLNAKVSGGDSETRQMSSMYHSQSIQSLSTNNKIGGDFKRDLKLFQVPPKVKRCLDGKTKEVSYLQESIDKEKQKLEGEIEDLISQFTKKLRNKKDQLFRVMDGYVESYSENYNELERRTEHFKDTTDYIKMQNSKNGDRLARLTSIVYYHQNTETNSTDVYKKEEHKTVCELRNLKKEMSKHSLEFYCKEIDKMAIHYPMFANTSSSSDYLTEMRDKLFSQVDETVNEFDRLLFAPPHIRIADITAEAQIFTSIGESKVNCLTNLKALTKDSDLSSSIYPTSHTGNITCVLNIDDVLVASGCEAGEIYISEHLVGKEKAQFKLKGSSKITSLAKIRALPTDLIEVTLRTPENQTPSAEQNYLISGHGAPDNLMAVWDIKGNRFVKDLRGHTEQITTIVALHDGHSIISGSEKGAIILHDISSRHPVKRFESLIRSSVNCIYLMNNLTQIAVGHQTGEINIYNLEYQNHPTHKRAVCSNLKLARNFKAKSAVLCINESHIDPDILHSGHEDNRIRIWNVSTAKVQKEITTNSTPVRVMLTIENPFSSESSSNYHLISFGDNKDDIIFNQPLQKQAFKLRFQSMVDLHQNPHCNPKIQLIRKTRKDAELGINFLTFVNDPASKPSILIISIN